MNKHCLSLYIIQFNFKRISVTVRVIENQRMNFQVKIIIPIPIIIKKIFLC